jgi:hypothetical protein
MVKVGDRIRLSSGKGPDREGVVTAVTGPMVRVRWPLGEETTVVPAPGTLTVLASSEDQAIAKKAGAKKAATKKTVTAKKAATETTSSKGAAKKTTGVKRSSR